MSFHVEASNNTESPILFPEFELATEPEEKDVEQEEDEVEEEEKTEVEEEENAEVERALKSEDGTPLAEGELVMCG